MIHEAMYLSARSRLLTLSVATTGSTTLAASGGTYTRTTGSFLTDGFAAGMELSASGFSLAGANGVRVVTKVEALTLTMSTAVGADSAASGRTLTVGLPALRAWENVTFEPVSGRPYVGEQYVPGPSRQITAGPLGVVELKPMYVLEVHTPTNVGRLASTRYTDAVATLFPPRTTMPVTGGHTLRVGAGHQNTGLGPLIGQVLPSRPGWVVQTVSIPLWLHVANTI